MKSESEVAQSCLTLRDPMDCSPPGSSAHGILQARLLEWGAIAFCAYLTTYVQIICVCVLVAQSCPTLCNPIDCSPPGPSVHGILQAKTMEGIAISFSKRNYRKKESEVAQSCPTLCNPMDCSLPGSPIHGIFQARVLEWIAIS